MKEIFTLMRPKHWIKNLLVFLPAFFSGNLWELSRVKNLTVGFFCFSFVASVVYIVNDMKDVEKDRQHEIKCKRPLASGAVSKKEAGITILCLIAGAVLCSCAIKSRQPLQHFFWCVFYFMLNLAYSIRLKNLPIIDVAVLASGFLIRIFYGAAVSGIEASSWLSLTVMSFALYMAIGKRRNELHKTDGSATRKVLQYYDVELLDRYMLIAATLGIVFYSLWAGMVTGCKWMVWTVPLVLFMIMKYEMILKGDSYGDPVEVLLSDRILCGLSVFYACLMLLLLYV